MTRKQSQQHDAQRKPSWRVRWKTMSRAVGMEIREHKSSFAVYVVLRMLVLAMAILQFFNGDYENVFLCILTLLLLLAPAFIQVQFRIELPSVLEVIVLVFVFSAEILGEISSFYDAIVHSISSVMLDPTHTNHAIRINDITQVTVNGQDLGLGGYLDIGLIDTMEDLVVNFIGAVVFSVFGFLYVKNRGKKDSIISRFVPRRKSADRDYLRLVIDGGSRESHTNMRDTVIEQTFDCPDKLDA